MALKVFEDWFTDHFVPEVEQYCTSKGMSFQVLLTLNNAPGHPVHLDDFHTNVKVVYLPSTTTALVVSVIASFKAYYLQRTIAMVAEATEKNKDLALRTSGDCTTSVML